MDDILSSLVVDTMPSCWDEAFADAAEDSSPEAQSERRNMRQRPRDHCSLLIKPLWYNGPNNSMVTSDLLLSHASWFHYSLMLRVCFDCCSVRLWLTVCVADVQ